MYDVVIRNGHLITAAGPVQTDLGIRGEQIAAIGHSLNGEHIIDAAGCYVIPGGVDPHVHLEMQLAGLTSTDTFATGTIAAAHGGTTSLLDFADPQPGQPMLDALQQRRATADPQVAVDYGLHMTVPASHAAGAGPLAEIPAVIAAGCPTFKLYQAYPRLELDDVSLYQVMAAVGAAGGRVVLHSETGPLLDTLRREAVAAGHRAPIWYARTRPPHLEASAVQRAAAIAGLAGCSLHIFHLGCAAAVAELAAARQRGVAISGESCPHYLLLSADEHLNRPDGFLYICAPPLRTRPDQEAVWRALAAGDLQVMSTDHCPWTHAEKESPPAFTGVPGGLPGIEARLALVHHFGVNENRLDLWRWVQLCCTAPARLMGLARKGALLPGHDADVVLFDPEREKRLETETLHEAVDWTPYAGITVRGWPRSVLLRGRVIVQDEEFLGRSGQGRFVARDRFPAK